MKIEYDVSGMHCSSCVGKVESALTTIPGVSSASVSLDPPRATVESDEAPDLSSLNDALSNAGDYRVVPRTEANAPGIHEAAGAGEAERESLYPLFLIVGYILATVVLIAWASGRWDAMSMMRHFMAGFFLVFSFFKLLDPAGFVSAYRGYDLIAKKSAAYARAYPFIELGLGVAYLLNLWPLVTNGVTLALMLLGSVGVLRALLDKRAIRCACLGTALNLPMTKVTLVEDLTMAVMAAVMIVLHLVG